MPQKHSNIDLSPSWISQLLGTVDALIIVFDLDGRIVLFNQVCEQVSGYTFETVQGQPYWDVLVPEAHRTLAERHFADLAHTSYEMPYEGDWVRKDGSRRRIAWKHTALRGEDGTVRYLAGTGIEVSALKESEARYKWLSAQTIEGITHHDKGIVVDVNERCCEIFGYTSNEMIGRPVIDFATPESGQIILNRIRSHLTGAYVVEGLRKDGTTFPLEIVTREAMQGDKLIRIAGLRDVSERAKLEKEHQKATEQLHRAQRMQTVGLLAGGIAHDFNNLLSVMLGSAELALQKVGPQEPVVHELNRIHDAAEVAATLTRQLLVFGGKDTPTPVVLDVGEVAQRLQDLIEGVVGEAIAVTMDIDALPSRVQIARPHLEQIIVNLVINASAAMEQGGRLAVRTRALSISTVLTTTMGQSLQPGNYVMLEIEDDGHGMSEAVARQALEPFFTTKQGGHGTGLGLSVVYSIVTACAGGLDLDTTPGIGTRWRIYLPSTDEDAHQSDVPAPVSVGQSGTILVVEDEEDVRELLVTALEYGGYQVLSADGAEQAIPLYEANKSIIGMLLTDVVMPHVTGPELAQQLRANDPDLPVMFISGYSEPVLKRHALGNVPLIQKPFRIADLLARVCEVINPAKSD